MLVQELVNQRIVALEQICQQFNIVILYVFGSRTKEVQAWVEGHQATLAPGPSDVDIGAKSRPTVDWDVMDKVEMALALEHLLGVYRVDLVSLDDAEPFLAANIIRGECLYTLDDYQADEYDLYILRRAGDLAPLERERLALIGERRS